MLTRAELIARIRERLEGRLSEAELANWAFDRFYALELGSETIEASAGDLVLAVLDDLMFASDDPSFALDPESLRALLIRLEEQ